MIEEKPCHVGDTLRRVKKLLLESTVSVTLKASRYLRLVVQLCPSKAPTEVFYPVW